MRILVTGAAGFIGSHVSERLLSRGHEVVGLDNFDPFYDPAIKRENVRGLEATPEFRLVEGDIRNRELLDALVGERRFDAIVHLAARAGVRPSLEDPRLYCEVNITGTVEILEAMTRHGIPKLVFASSSSVYGSREGAPFRETDTVDFPISPYAATKKAGELICYTYHHNHGMDVSCLRFFTVYGPRQRPEMAIHRFTRIIDEGRTVDVYGDGSSRRDYTYIDDTVDGIVGALERSRGYRIYNFGNHQTVGLLELIHHLEELLGKKANLRFLPVQAGDVPLTCAAIERARDELGYRPEFPIRRGLERFVHWFRDTQRSNDAGPSTGA